MKWGSERLLAERIVDAAAAALLAAAMAFAHAALSAQDRATSAAVAAASFLLAHALLRRVPVEQREFLLPEIELMPLEITGTDQRSTESELLLDDPLVPDPHGRVVQLFGPARHSVECRGEAADASQALVEALLELRRSLR